MIVSRGKLLLMLAPLALSGCEGFFGPPNTDRPEVTAAKSRQFYQGTMEELLSKYCDRPTWQYNEKTHRVEFRGLYKPAGQELVILFRIKRSPMATSNTADDWVALRESVTLGGRRITGPIGQIFPDEDRLVNPGREADKNAAPPTPPATPVRRK